MAEEDPFHRVWDSDSESSAGYSEKEQIDIVANLEPQTSLVARHLEEEPQAASSDTLSALRTDVRKDHNPSDPGWTSMEDGTGLACPNGKGERNTIHGSPGVCSICRGTLQAIHLSCTKCESHLMCPTCHDKFAGDLWPTGEHEFILATSQKSSSNGFPVANNTTPNGVSMLPIDYNALLASQPSLGSIHHAAGTCHPCHYAHSRVGCHFGRLCGLCHYTHKRKVKRAKKKDMAGDDRLSLVFESS